MVSFIKRALNVLSHKTDNQSGHIDFNYSFNSKKKTALFEEIAFHQDIKRVLVKALISTEPVHILLVGKPGSAKTMFLTEIMRHTKSSLFIVGSNTTKAGLINQLFEKEPKFLLIDELDKMNKTDQASLLHLMESGLISETKVNKTREVKLSVHIIATGNSYDRIIEPLLSRFAVLQVPEYTFQEFSQLSILRLVKLGVERTVAAVIAEQVWDGLGSKDIRDAVKVGKLVNSVQEVPFIIKMMKRQ